MSSVWAGGIACDSSSSGIQSTPMARCYLTGGEGQWLRQDLNLHPELLWLARRASGPAGNPQEPRTRRGGEGCVYRSATQPGAVYQGSDTWHRPPVPPGPTQRGGPIGAGMTGLQAEL
jgi:hypothetical protein